MRISKLWPGYAIAVTLLATACGGGSSSTSTPPTAAPTTVVTATPAPGPLLVGYTVSNGGATVAASAAPAAIAFAAQTQTAAVTASQANYSGSYTAAANTACGTAVTVTPATSTTGAFTITAANTVTVAAGCQVTFTGATTSTVSVGASVPAPGGVVLQWVANAANASAAGPGTVTPLAGPINLIGVTSTFGAVLVISETHYLGTFNAPVLSGACGANLSAPTAGVIGNIIAPQVGQAAAYYNVSAPAAAAPFAISAGCTITVTDNAATPNTSAAMGVALTSTTGGII